jgi:hypothetical protein
MKTWVYYIAKAKREKQTCYKGREEMTSETWPPPRLEDGIVPSSLFGFDKLVFFNLKGYCCCI